MEEEYQPLGQNLCPFTTVCDLSFPFKECEQCYKFLHVLMSIDQSKLVVIEK